MKVKTLQNHRNVFGAKDEKAPNEEYELPADHAAALIASGIVEEVKGADAPEPAVTAKAKK